MSEPEFRVDLDDLDVDVSTWQDVAASISAARDHVVSVEDVPVGGTGGPGYLAGLESTYETLAQEVADLLASGMASMQEVASRLAEARDLYDEAEGIALDLAAEVDV